MRVFLTAAILTLLAAAPRPASAPTATPNPKLNCGEAAWTVIDPKNETTVFNSTAECTTVESNPYLNSIMGPENGRLQLWITYTNAGVSHCSNGGPISITLSGVKAPPGGLEGSYSAGGGNPPPTGSSCEFSIADLPRRPGTVRGGLKAVLGRCSKVGGCAKPSDWDLVSVNGSFEAYYRGD